MTHDDVQQSRFDSQLSVEQKRKMNENHKTLQKVVDRRVQQGPH